MDPLLQTGLKRQKKIAEWETRIQLLHQKYPRLEEISFLIAQLSLELALVELGKTKTGMGRDELLQAQAALLEEKKSLLKKHNIPDNIYDIWWDCPYCRDTGFAGPGVKCSCLYQAELKQRWQMSGLSPEQEEQTFTTFSLEWYKDKERHRNILKDCLDFAEKVSKGERTENMLLYGPVGIGKTHLCSAIANYVLQAGVSVIYMKTGLLLDMIREAKLQDKGSNRMHTLYRVGLLILDDLGTESLTDFVHEQLFLLLDERINLRLPWVISTNLSPNELTGHYELRLMDRIIGTSQILKFEGESVRCRKKRAAKKTANK